MKENENREAIFRYIEKHPGAHYSKIKKVIGLCPGNMTYHVQKLENSGRIISQRNGCLKCFYPDDRDINPSPFTVKQSEVMDVITQRSDISIKDIADEIGKTSQAIEYHIKNLVVLKAVESKKKMGKTHLYRIRKRRSPRKKKKKKKS